MQMARVAGGGRPRAGGSRRKRDGRRWVFVVYRGDTPLTAPVARRGAAPYPPQDDGVVGPHPQKRLVMSEPIGPAEARERLRSPLRELRESLGLSSDREDRGRDWWAGHRFTPEYPQYI